MQLFQLPETAYVREVVFIEPEAPTATCMSMNLNLAQYMYAFSPQSHTPIAPAHTTSSCLEHISYTPHPAAGGIEEAPSTLFSQRALMMSAFPTKMIARRIEKASVDRFRSNAGVGQQGFEWVLQRGQELMQGVPGE
jgi:hypothetical protein